MPYPRSKSLSSFLNLPPILFTTATSHTEHTERERQLQLTLDKLEGRISIPAHHYHHRIGIEDAALEGVCGIMSMLGDENPLDDYRMFGEWIDDDDDDRRDKVVIPTVRGEMHPAFSWVPGAEEGWETSNRISEDSLFNSHTRQPPVCSNHAVARFRPFGPTIPPFRESLCARITAADETLLRSPPPVHQKRMSHANLLQPPIHRASYVPPLPYAVLQGGKTSLVKRIIRVVVQPMKMLSVRKKKKQKKNVEIRLIMAGDEQGGAERGGGGV